MGASTRPLPPADINPWGRSIETDVNSLLQRMDRALSDVSNALQTANTALNAVSRISAQFAVAFGTTQSAITTETVVADISVPITLDASANLRVDAQLRHYASTTDVVISVALKDNGTTVAVWTRMANSSPSAAGTVHTSDFSVILPNVTAGSHTFTLTANRAAGTGNITLSPDTTGPSFLSIAPV